MSTAFNGSGNIGSTPEVRTFPSNNNEPPRGLLRLNVSFSNRVRNRESGEYEDRNGFWANVTWWFRDAAQAEHLSKIFQVGMGVRVDGHLEQQSWQDRTTGEDRSAFAVIARHVYIDPRRIESVVLQTSDQQHQQRQEAQPPTSSQPAENYQPSQYPSDGEWDDAQDGGSPF
ncbi:single-stranded DNA-binding protein [Carnimonas bestiolae]|uniref:single-stranded DNA-binding protein n=1 Tax=Carnimonas bestiolae TaxID=3402172 RepID=UPI003EDC528D